MPGFCISNVENNQILKNRYPERCVSGSIQCEAYLLQWNTLNKYKDDKIFGQDEKYGYVLEGVLLNKKELFDKYHVNSVKSLLQQMYRISGDRFCVELHGSFSGGIYDKSKDKWVLFTDQIGTKPLYYYMDGEGRFICGTQLNYVTDTMKLNGITRKADVHGLNCLLTHGYMLDESTVVKNVKRLYPGDYFVWNNSKIHVSNYYILNSQKKVLASEQDYIELLDSAFVNAVKRLIEKDEEYGYRSVLDISGGVDSRMIVYTAKRLGCRNAIMISYSQSGGREQKIAQEVANKFEYDFYFKSLDNAKCLYQIDENVHMNNGSAIYDGITGGKDMLELLNSNDFGIEITGLLGDVYEGSMDESYGEEKPFLDYPRFRFSRILSFDNQTYSNVMNRFDNNELFWFYTRGMLCGMATFQIRQNYVEPMTPFGDTEFMEAYLSIPWEIRVKGKLLVKWLTNKYPEAGRIMYAATGITPAEEFTKVGKIKKIFKFVNQEIHRQLHIMHRGYQMNPYAYWCKLFPEINEFAQEYYNKNIHRVDEELRGKIEKLMKLENDFEDKSPALTVLSCYKTFLD